MGKLLAQVLIAMLVGGVAYVAVNSDKEQIKQWFGGSTVESPEGLESEASGRPDVKRWEGWQGDRHAGGRAKVKPATRPDVTKLAEARDRAAAEFYAAEERGDRQAARYWFDEYYRLDAAIQQAR